MFHRILVDYSDKKRGFARANNSQFDSIEAKARITSESVSKTRPGDALYPLLEGGNTVRMMTGKEGEKGERKKKRREHGTRELLVAVEGRGKLSVCISAWTGAHNFILSSLGLYLDLLAGPLDTLFRLYLWPRHAAASRGKVASVASVLTKSGGKHRKDPSRFISRPIADSRDHSPGNKHSLNAIVSQLRIDPSRAVFVPSSGHPPLPRYGDNFEIAFRYLSHGVEENALSLPRVLHFIVLTFSVSKLVERGWRRGKIEIFTKACKFLREGWNSSIRVKYYTFEALYTVFGGKTLREILLSTRSYPNRFPLLQRETL